MPDKERREIFEKEKNRISEIKMSSKDNTTFSCNPRMKNMR